MPARWSFEVSVADGALVKSFTVVMSLMNRTVTTYDTRCRLDIILDSVLRQTVHWKATVGMHGENASGVRKGLRHLPRAA